MYLLLCRKIQCILIGDVYLLLCRKIQCILRRELIGDVYLLLCRKIQCILIGDMHRLPSTQIRVEFRVDYMR